MAKAKTKYYRNSCHTTQFRSGISQSTEGLKIVHVEFHTQQKYLSNQTTDLPYKKCSKPLLWPEENTTSKLQSTQRDEKVFEKVYVKVDITDFSHS